MRHDSCRASRNTVCFLGGKPSPDGSARVRHSALALREAGFEVVVVGLARSVADVGVRQWQGIEYRALEPVPVGLSALRYLREGCALADWLGVAAHTQSAAAVVLTSPYFRRLMRVLPLCHRLGVVCVADLMEWSSTLMLLRRNWLRGWLDVLDVQAALRFGVTKANGIIAISRCLEQHCASVATPVIRIPPLIDTRDSAWQYADLKGERREVRLLFMGTYVRDRQDLLLTAVGEARQRGLPVRLEFLGCTREDFCKSTGLERQVGALGEGIRFYGRVAFHEVPKIVRAADFGVLLRDDARWSRACFPSKLVELAALGIPMLCNLSSDLGLYLEDGINSIVVSRLTVRDVVVAIERAVQLSAAQLLDLRRASRRMAERHFDYRHYSEPLRAFILSVQAHYRQRMLAR